MTFTGPGPGGQSVTVCAGGAVPFRYWTTVEVVPSRYWTTVEIVPFRYWTTVDIDVETEVAPGRVDQMVLVSGAQVPALAFCVYHTVLGEGVYQRVLGTQLEM